MSKYEIELRGPLKPAQKEKLEKILASSGKLVREYSRTQWCFKNSLDKKDIRIRKRDLRIKNTNGSWEISLKIGEFAKTNRKEISIPIPSEHKNQAFDLLKFLGHNRGIVAVRKAKIYVYNNIEWAIVQTPNDTYYFEAEKLIANKRNSKFAEDEIKDVCLKLGLKIFTKEEFYRYIDILDREVNKPFKI